MTFRNIPIPKEILLPGDIVFVASKGYLGKLIKLRQEGLKAFKANTFIPTHVALVISTSGLLIESTIEDGVEIHGIHKYIDNENYEDTFLIMRNIALEKSIEENHELLNHYSNEFTKNWREKYNYGAFIKMKKNGKKFCSELAFDCLKMTSIIDDDRDASNIYPFDLFKLVADDKKWRIVEAAAMLSLSQKRINLFFDELIQKQQTNKKELHITIEKLESANNKVAEIIDSKETPSEIKDKLNIILDFTQIIPILKKGLDSHNEMIANIEKHRTERLLTEQEVRNQFKALIETEKNWMLMKTK